MTQHEAHDLRPGPMALLTSVPIGRLSAIAIRGSARRLTRRPKDKVFAIGFNKSGTTSLHHLFQDLGFRSFHGIHWRDSRNRTLLHAFDAFSDGPPQDFQALHRLFPTAKFILNTRDLEGWVLSRLKHVARDRTRDTRPATWSVSHQAVEAWITDRNNYHARVLRYFQAFPEQLLVVNLTRDKDAANKIAGFLNRPSPGAMPVANRSNGRGLAMAHREVLVNVATRLGIPKANLANDLINTAPDAALYGDLPQDTRALTLR